MKTYLIKTHCWGKDTRMCKIIVDDAEEHMIDFLGCDLFPAGRMCPRCESRAMDDFLRRKQYRGKNINSPAVRWEGYVEEVE